MSRRNGRSQIIPDDSISADTRASDTRRRCVPLRDEERNVIQPHDEKLPFAFPLQARCATRRSPTPRRSTRAARRESPPPSPPPRRTLHNFTNRAYNRSAGATKTCRRLEPRTPRVGISIRFDGVTRAACTVYAHTSPRRCPPSGDTWPRHETRDRKGLRSGEFV